MLITNRFSSFDDYFFGPNLEKICFSPVVISPPEPQHVTLPIGTINMETEDATSLGINTGIVYFIRSMLMPTALFGDGNASTFTIVVDVVLTCCVLFCLGRIFRELPRNTNYALWTFAISASVDLLIRVVFYLMSVYVNTLGIATVLCAVGIVFNPWNIFSLCSPQYRNFYPGNFPPWIEAEDRCLDCLFISLITDFIRVCFALLWCIPIRLFLK